MKKRNVIWVTLLTCVGAIGSAAAEHELVGKVIGIQDGDTLTLLDPENQQHRIRLSGIDAPEKGQPYSQVSSSHLAELSFNRLALAHCPKVD